MLLTKLAICDFRSFQGHHEIDLAPRNKFGERRPIILFGGLNGTGKTSILTAVRLALYGPLALDGRPTSKEYERFLAESIHSNPHAVLAADNAYVELHFEYGQLGELFTYRVQRSWTRKGSRVHEQLRIWKNEEPVRGIDREAAQSFLNELVPVGVSDLFFFDGEKIAELAEDQDGSALGDALRRLVGIDLAERLRADLGVYLRRKATKKATAADRRKSAQLEKNYEAAKRDVQRLEEDLALRDEALRNRQADVETQEHKLRELGGQWAAGRDAEEQRLRILNQKHGEQETRLREFAAGLLPFTLAEDALRDAATQAAGELNEQHASAVSQRLAAAIAVLRDEADHEHVLSKKAKAWLDQRLRQIVDEGDTDGATPSSVHAYEAGPRELTQWQTLIDDFLPEVKSEATSTQQALAQTKDALDLAGLKLARAPADEALETTWAALKEAQDARDQQAQAAAQKRAELREVIKYAIQLVRELKRNEEQMAAHSASERPVEYAHRTRNLMTQYIAQVSAAKVADLETEFAKAFGRLARKDDLRVHARIDPDTYQVRLIDERGEGINRNQLSAGERQIYAIAMLEALAQTSGRRLPVIIDTPLGRLDSKHRTKLVQHYFPRASHQVLILSTDTEVDASFYQALSPDISHAFEIEYDPESSASQLREGYFWRHLEAVPEAS